MSSSAEVVGFTRLIRLLCQAAMTSRPCGSKVTSVGWFRRPLTSSSLSVSGASSPTPATMCSLPSVPTARTRWLFQSTMTSRPSGARATSAGAYSQVSRGGSPSLPSPAMPVPATVQMVPGVGSQALPGGVAGSPPSRSQPTRARPTESAIAPARVRMPWAVSVVIGSPSGCGC